MRGENGWEITVQRSGDSDNKKREDRSILSAKGKLLLLVDYRVVLYKTQFEWIIYRALPTMLLRHDVAIKTWFLPSKKRYKKRNGSSTIGRRNHDTGSLFQTCQRQNVLWKTIEKRRRVSSNGEKSTRSIISLLAEFSPDCLSFES